MKETVDYLFSHMISIWILIFMLFCGWMGSTLLGVNNYTHETQEVISRNGGLTKTAYDQLDSLKSHYRHIDGVTLYKETKDGKADQNADKYRKNRIPYGATETYVIWVNPNFLGYKIPIVKSVNSDVRQ